MEMGLRTQILRKWPAEEDKYTWRFLFSWLFLSNSLYTPLSGGFCWWFSLLTFRLENAINSWNPVLSLLPSPALFLRLVLNSLCSLGQSRTHADPPA